MMMTCTHENEGKKFKPEEGRRGKGKEEDEQKEAKGRLKKNTLGISN